MSVPKKILASDVPSIRDAKLPPGYQAAKQALAKCSRIDECAEWSRKADAIASYAKQANDKSLETMALRIRARAIRRCGELLRKITAQKGGDKKSKGRGLPVDRKGTAEAAGLSEHQRKTALRVANVPEDEFESAVEGGTPATVRRLAEQGKAPGPVVDLRGKDPEEYKQATQVHGELRRTSAFLQAHDVDIIIRGTQDFEYDSLRQHCRVILLWCQAMLTKIGESDETG